MDHPRPRSTRCPLAGPGRRRRVRALALGLVAAVLLASAGPSRPAERAAPPLNDLMRQLLEPDLAVREAALRAIVQRGERAAVPGLIDVLRFDLFLDSSLAAALDGLTGQTFGHDWPRWVEWLAGRPDVRPHPDYAGWKGALFALIDPAFNEFLHASVKHRVRLEEIQWGGVRKDGIPALTNPRHVAAREATYLTPDELVLGVVIRGEARAYPLRIMDWHEMANDVVGGVPISLAY